MTGPLEAPGQLPQSPEPDRPVALLLVQVLSLVAFAGYGTVALMRGVEPNNWVLGGLLAFGLGLRPETLGEIMRRVLIGKGS